MNEETSSDKASMLDMRSLFWKDRMIEIMRVRIGWEFRLGGKYSF
jgi:hypothetical protein